MTTNGSKQRKPTLCAKSLVKSTHQILGGPIQYVRISVSAFAIPDDFASKYRDGINVSFSDVEAVQPEDNETRPYLTGRSAVLARALNCDEDTQFVIVFDAFSNHVCGKFVASLKTPLLWTLK